MHSLLPDPEQGADQNTPGRNALGAKPAATPKSTPSAQKRFKVFARRVKKAKTSPLLSKPPPMESTTPRPQIKRSRRITAQSLSRIPTAKRGEYLVLKRLGHASALNEESAPGKFEALFSGNPEDEEALRELFPVGCLDGRSRRRRRVPRSIP